MLILDIYKSAPLAHDETKIVLRAFLQIRHLLGGDLHVVASQELVDLLLVLGHHVLRHLRERIEDELAETAAQLA